MNVKQKLVAGAAMLAPLSAFAAAPDTTAITTAISDNQTAAVTVALAFAVAVLVIRSLKLIKRA